MRVFSFIPFILIAACILMITGCSSSKGSQCGCPNKGGMVGYK